METDSAAAVPAICSSERWQSLVMVTGKVSENPPLLLTAVPLSSSSLVQASKTLRLKFCNRTYNSSSSVQWPT